MPILPEAEFFAVDLINGAFEQPLWGQFLARLLQAAGADNATLVFQPPGWLREDALILVSGTGTVEDVRNNYRRYGYPNVNQRRWMEAGRAYNLAELIQHDGHSNDDFFEELKRVLKVADVLDMRVQEPGGVEAWLSLARSDNEFTPDIANLLAQLAPMLTGVLRSYLALEEERFAASLARDAVERMQFGWIALDRDMKLVGTDPFAKRVLDSGIVIARDPANRLHILSASHRADVEHAVARLSDEPHGKPFAIQLSDDPWLDMLLVTPGRKTLSRESQATVIAYVHGDNWRSADRARQLADLFSLTEKEARLALALCRGSSIAEAAPEIGLTVGSARIYSKSIYAKTGARGQPDLVRIVMGSILAMSPEHG